MTATLLVAWAAGLAQPAPDAPLRQLQTEIRDVAKVQVELLFKDMEKGPGASYTDTAAAVRRLADAEADLGDPAAAVKWAERWVESLKKREEFVKKLLERGTGSLTEFLHVVIARINAEIEFIRRQEAVKGGPQARAVRGAREDADRVGATDRQGGREGGRGTGRDAGPSRRPAGRRDRAGEAEGRRQVIAAGTGIG